MPGLDDHPQANDTYAKSSPSTSSTTTTKGRTERSTVSLPPGPFPAPAEAPTELHRRDRLGGLIHEYYADAA